VRAATARFLARHRDDAPAALRGTNGGATPPPSAGTVLPNSRVVSLYGAPQLTKTIVGMKSPKGAAAKLVKQSAPYAKKGVRPVIGEIDLIATIATAGPGPDRKYRTRQADTVIATYLDAARSVGARLMLDIQPGRSTFLAELRAVRDWLLQPDVDLALDPEWNVGRRGVPGRTPGSVAAKKVNKVSLRLQQTIDAAGLPPKLLVVHQFRRKSVRGRRQLTQRPGVETVLNFDGIGGPRAKAAGYAALSAPQLFDGFSLFYRRDRPLMQPASVLGLLPEPDFLLYQ
ncbi:MAG: hypothetical protein ACRDKX_00310, partial [Solirubrobacterales bacterium]